MSDEFFFDMLETTVKGNYSTYEINQLLGKGGFGAVYKVFDEKTKTHHAMKIERKMEGQEEIYLKMEVMVLKAMKNEAHFPQLVDRGKMEKEGFCFMVMELVGKNLADLKVERETKVFSFRTGLGVAYQCLEACQALYKHHFVHRDLKPQNFSCGLGKKNHLIYMLDFGLVRKFVDEKMNKIKPPRDRLEFIGTIDYASIASHEGSDIGPKDDCESWFYLLLDLIAPQGLPWKKMKDMNDVLKCKKEYRKDKREALFNGLPHKTELIPILDYIYARQYHHGVDYNSIYQLLKKACHLSGGKIDEPYDWEMKKDLENYLQGFDYDLDRLLSIPGRDSGRAKLSIEGYDELFKIWKNIPKNKQLTLIEKVASIKRMSAKTIRDKTATMEKKEIDGTLEKITNH